MPPRDKEMESKALAGEEQRAFLTEASQAQPLHRWLCSLTTESASA